MAKINRFEDIEIWQKSREICQYVELLIQTTALQQIIHLKIKLTEVRDLLWITLSNDLTETVIGNLYNF
jgi:hypothetical protein